MMDTLDWTFEFRDAPDLEAAGEALTRKLESFIDAGPPTTARELTDRQTFEAIVAAFIARARERNFAFTRIPGFVDLFKAFTAHNIKTEDAAAAALGKTANSAPAPAPPAPSLTSTNPRTPAEFSTCVIRMPRGATLRRRFSPLSSRTKVATRGNLGLTQARPTR